MLWLMYLWRNIGSICSGNALNSLNFFLKSMKKLTHYFGEPEKLAKPFHFQGLPCSNLFSSSKFVSSCSHNRGSEINFVRLFWKTPSPSELQRNRHCSFTFLYHPSSDAQWWRGTWSHYVAVTTAAAFSLLLPECQPIPCLTKHSSQHSSQQGWAGVLHLRWEECRDAARVCRDGIRKAKAQLELH